MHNTPFRLKSTSTIGHPKPLAVESPIANTTNAVSGVYFDVVSETGVEYDHPFIVPLEPDLAATLHPGSSHEGWGGYQVAINDSKPLITFGRNYDGIGSICFKLY